MVAIGDSDQGEPVRAARPPEPEPTECLRLRRYAQHTPGDAGRSGERGPPPPGRSTRVSIRRRPPRLPRGPGRRQERVDIRGLPAVRARCSRVTLGGSQGARGAWSGGLPAERARPGGHRREQNRSTGLEMEPQAAPETALAARGSARTASTGPGHEQDAPPPHRARVRRRGRRETQRRWVAVCSCGRPPWGTVREQRTPGGS